MSATISPDHILQTRGVSRELGAYVVGTAFARGGRTCAFATGEGTLHVAPRLGGGAWRSVPAHDGAILALAPGAGPADYISGGDDGRFRRVEEAPRTSPPLA